MPRTPCAVIAALALPSIASASVVTILSVEREISGMTAPAAMAQNISDQPGLFDEFFELTPTGASTASASQTSDITTASGLLQLAYSSATSTAILDDTVSPVSATAISRLSIGFEIQDPAPWSLTGTVSSLGDNLANARFQLTGPGSPFFLEPVTEGGVASVNESGVLAPGSYTLSFAIGGTSSLTRDPGAIDIAADLNFAIVPAPSALALLALAPLAVPRRR